MRNIFFIIISALMSLCACKKESEPQPDECSKHTFSMHEDYKDWFIKTNDLPELNARNSDSLFDAVSLYMDEYTQTGDYRDYCDTIEDAYCDVLYHLKKMSLNRYFYSLSLTLTLEMNDDIPKLELQNENLSYNLGIHLKDSVGFRFTRHPCRAISFPPQMETLPVDTIYGEPYYNVIRLTDTYIEANGKGTDILAYHIHPDYGIIKWQEKSGVVWEVEIE